MHPQTCAARAEGRTVPGTAHAGAGPRRRKREHASADPAHGAAPVTADGRCRVPVAACSASPYGTCRDTAAPGPSATPTARATPDAHVPAHAALLPGPRTAGRRGAGVVPAGAAAGRTRVRRGTGAVVPATVPAQAFVMPLLPVTPYAAPRTGAPLAARIHPLRPSVVHGADGNGARGAYGGPRDGAGVLGR